MTTKTKQARRPRVGDECWEVEWCSKLAFYDDDPTGDVDHDRCEMSFRHVATKEDAELVAREVYPEAVGKFGVVGYCPMRFVPYDEDDAMAYPHAGYWEATADPEYYEGED